MHLDLVSFPRPVCIQEVRVIPAGHRVHAAVSERDKMGYVKSCNLKVRTTYSVPVLKKQYHVKELLRRFDLNGHTMGYYFSVTDSKVRTISQVSIIQSVVPYRFFYFLICAWLVLNIICDPSREKGAYGFHRKPGNFFTVTVRELDFSRREFKISRRVHSLVKKFHCRRETSMP